MGLFSHLLLILTTLVVGAAITVQFTNNTSTTKTTATAPHNHLSTKHEYERIVVFGDSLSDNGDFLFALTHSSDVFTGLFARRN